MRKDSPIGCVPPDKTCVLIVEDDSALLGFLFSALVAEGFALVAATDGQQALDLLERGLRPHVILIDLALPRVSGYELIEDLRARASTRTLPVVVLTTRAGAKHVNLARELGVEHYVAKPVDEASFVRLIESLAVTTPARAGA